ncbi:MAG: signal peptidase I [Erysipelotrichaceae bacterium]
MVKDKIIDELLEFVKIFIISVIAVILFVTFIAKPVTVMGSSMYPTLVDGDYGFSSVISLNISELKRFDVVVIESEELDELIVKRIIGLPSETIAYQNDQLYVNGVLVEEAFLDNEYVREQKEKFGYFTDDFEIELAENEYFYLGDNRLNSTDARVLGPITKDKIFCKGLFTLLPLERFAKGA